MANLILLNGTSSSGKTSIATEIQQRMAEPYLRTGIDPFLSMLPSRYLNLDAGQPGNPIRDRPSEAIPGGRRDPPDEGFRWVPPREDSAKGIRIQVGPLGHQLVATMHRALATIASLGHHLIIDHVLLEPRWLEDAVLTLADYDVLFVGVRCPLAVVEKRERERGDRTVGQARGHFDIVHSLGTYDLEVDTSVLTPPECALQIVQRLQQGPRPGAFEQLRRALTP